MLSLMDLVAYWRGRCVYSFPSTKVLHANGRRVHLNTVDSCAPSILGSWVWIWIYASSIYSQIVGTTNIWHCDEKDYKKEDGFGQFPIS